MTKDWDQPDMETSTSFDPPKAIHFTDTEIETGVVIKSLLDSCFHQEFQVLDLKVAMSVSNSRRNTDYQIMGKLFTQMMITNGKSLPMMRVKLTFSH
jgi:hypothetical protein